MNNKIGIGIITCDRPDYFKVCLSSIIGSSYDELVVVNDGKPLPSDTNTDKTHVINNTPQRQGVGATKNKAMQHLLNKDCTHIFIVEDDVEIKDKTVFEQYITAAKHTNILHFNFGPGTPFNRKQIMHGDVHNRHLLEQNSKPCPRIVVDYKDLKLALYLHIAGTFSYFHRSVLDKVGLIDEQFYNAWDHVEHTYRIIKSGFHPPFWWFADLANSDSLLSIQSAALDNSSIAEKGQEWYKNLEDGMKKYKNKHGWVPNQTPDTQQQSVIQNLLSIKNRE
jgi:GT2 family glycosyltransferase